jgi:hypothetical protein
MSEAPSATTFVMGARLPWPDDSPAIDTSGPFDPAIVHDCGSRRNCSVRKVSALGATLRGDIGTAPGEDVAVELVTGQRPGATVDWVSGGETGVRFDEPIDMLAMINRELVSQPVERRAMPRVEIRCGAYVKCGGDIVPVVIRNISARGLQLEGDGLPRSGTFVSVLIEGLVVPAGEVAWSKSNLAGIALLDDLSWSSIMPWIRDLVRKQAI